MPNSDFFTICREYQSEAYKGNGIYSYFFMICWESLFRELKIIFRVAGLNILIKYECEMILELDYK